jgi:hypothetical protein
MWLAGGAFGAVFAVVGLSFGTPVLYLALVLFAFGFLVSRSVALLSGAFLAAGVTWLALAMRASIACEEFDRLPNAGCTAPDLTPFLLTAAGMGALGVLLGWIAFRRPRALEDRSRDRHRGDER